MSHGCLVESAPVHASAIQAVVSAMLRSINEFGAKPITMTQVGDSSGKIVITIIYGFD